MSPSFTDATALTYRPDLDVLFVRWPQPVYAFATREVYQRVLDLAQETNARYWLFDLRSRGSYSEEDSQWIRDEFFPSLHSRFGNVTHVAYLLTPAHIKDYAFLKAAAEARQKTWYGKWADFEGFTSETEALNWLKHNQLAEMVN